MTPAARTRTAIELLDAILASQAGADTVIANGFKARRYAGSKDRRAVRELIYRAIRRFGDPPASGRAAMAALADADDVLAATFDGSAYGPAALLPDEPRATGGVMPAWLAARLPDEASLDRAPLDLRVNRLKATRDEVSPLFPDATPVGSDGLRLTDPINVEASDAYRDGRIEVQDFGSQLIVEACAAAPATIVVDLCAGAGGKTLALAAAMRNEGRLIACDTARDRLRRLEPRAQRAGAECEVRLLDGGREAEQLADLEGLADVVLIDAPCSGTGTLRRNPEARWRLTPERVEALVVLQRHVIDLALPLVKPGGALVYAVCSQLREEGAAQVEALLAREAGWSAAPLPFGTADGPGIRLSPQRDGTDGFFVARLIKAC
ncbi:Ribosomal RNA small subunit methyltransferase B [Sphingomonas antarctica]|uniref:RsmB/NOP family class I SAM-dependent RNA methyltransferase n=1 Tax=Sphingomonas antarctica TaxID=2040274 RepID=UPI0039E8DF32